MEFLASISDFLWGPWTPWVLLAAGVLFTVWTRFTQYTAMTHGVQVVRGIYDDPDDPGAINHFQALSAALSATVGLGNIGGVALAIGIGGPGAIVWMWLVGFFGMALKTVEITLSMMYRNLDDPKDPHGGAMWVVDAVIGGKGGRWRIVAKAIGVFFCITLVISTITGGNMFQTWNVAGLTETYFGVPRIGTGIVMAAIVGMVIIGGIKRIGNVAGKLVPFMCVLYVVSAFAVLAMNVGDILPMFGLIFRSAFSPVDAGGAFIGGTVGFAFMQGMKRALFSNEAGQGSAPIAHAAAKTDQAAREGIVGGIGPFVDTLMICTLTALVILSTGTWDRDAIGPLTGGMELVQVADADVPTWRVEASTDVASLPESRYFDSWQVEANFYVVAEFEGATHIESGAQRLMVKGEVAEVGNPSGEGLAQLAIVWEDLEFGPEDWEGEPTSFRLLDDTGVHRAYDGASLTGHAFDRQFPGLGKWLVTLAAWLFAISTMISWSYYGEQGMIYMVGKRGVLPYKIGFLLLAIVATNIDDAGDMIILMDLGTGAMLWANISIVLGLGFLAVKELNIYGRRLKAGDFPRNDRPKADKGS
jgi:alanine or glycine:cation symporter, AGCS family